MKPKNCPMIPTISSNEHSIPTYQFEEKSFDTLFQGLEDITPDEKKQIVHHFIESIAVEMRRLMKKSLEAIKRMRDDQS